MNIKLFAGSAHPDLARRMAQAIGVDLGEVQLGHFPGGEISVKYIEHLRGEDVFIIQPTCSPPNENLMELLVMLDAARRASCARITAVLPFFGYARQDRKEQPRVPITAKLVANLLVTAGAERILTMDLHAQQIQGFFDIPVDHLYAAPVLVSHLRKILKPDAVIVSPDSGSVKMAQAYADMLGAGFAVVAKRRISATQVESSHLVGDVQGRDCVLVDDLTTTASTLSQAAERLRDAGAAGVYAAVSHCCLTPEGLENLRRSCIQCMVVTDSVPQPSELADPKVQTLSIAGLLGEAIRRIHAGESVSSLFQLEEAGDL